MGRPAAALVHNVHGDVIPHGISSVPFASSNEKELGIEGKSVTFTFGLLSPDKGIEHVIDALPVILARYPDTIERADK